ncbi:acyl-CoA thioesterase [Sulfolobales archaeon HS-7]|nr:acyl-CoA thioesterase [Sulfolobales archaeon HS-7]
MLRWLADAGLLCVVKAVKGQAVLATLDDVVFHKGVKLGDIISIYAEIQFVGRTSVEVEMKALRGNELIANAYGSYVKVDRNLRPLKIEEIIEPDDQEIWNVAMRRREERLQKIKDRNERRFDVTNPTIGFRYIITNSLNVTPDLTYNGVTASAGRILKIMDDTGGILCLNYIGYPYSNGHVVTAAVSRTSFYSPVMLGDYILIRGCISYVGRTSMEVTLNVIKYEPQSGITEHVTTTYFTFVHIDENGKPIPVKQYSPETDEEKKEYERAIQRRKKS